MKVCGKDQKYLPSSALGGNQDEERRPLRSESNVVSVGGDEFADAIASSFSTSLVDQEEHGDSRVLLHQPNLPQHEQRSLEEREEGKPLLGAPLPTQSNKNVSDAGENNSKNNPHSPQQRLRRTSKIVDPPTESTALQRLVEYFVVISCRPQQRSASTSSSERLPKVEDKPEPHKERRKNRFGFRRERTEQNLPDDTAPAPKEANDTPDLSFHPKITARYPLKDHRDNPLNPMIMQFCFPTGDEIVPSKTYHLPRVHYFVLTNEKGRKVYGICLTMMEDYRPKQGEKWTQQADVKDANQSGSIEITDDEASKVLYIPKVLCLLSTWPYLTAFREYLAQLYRLATATNVMTVPIERYVVNLCAEIPAPPPGSYEIQVSILDSKIRLWAPPAKLPIAYVALPYRILFECLDMDHILDLFCALIMEHKIVLLSSSYSILTICSEILCSMLFPMKWSHLYIPILPKMLCPMLDAPVPYIVGVVRENWLVAQDQIASDAIVVDLDHNKIALGRDTPSIPAPPSKKWNKLQVSLQLALGNIFERAHDHANNKSTGSAGQEPTNSFRKSFRKSYFPKIRDYKDGPAWKEKLESWDHAFNLAYTPNSELMDDFSDQAGFGSDGQTQWDKVQEAFMRFFVALLKDYRKYLTTSTNSRNSASQPSFDASSFLDSQPAVNKPFIQAMLSTQQFDDFITRRMYSPGEPELAFFDQSIDAKLNRSKLKLKKLDTPFVQNAKAHKELKKVKAIEPNEEGLPNINVDRVPSPYIYIAWPDLFDENKFSRPRPVPKIISAEFDRQDLLVSRLRIDSLDIEDEGTEFYGGDFDSSPEVGAFTLFFFTYSALVGLEWQHYQHKTLVQLEGIPPENARGFTDDIPKLSDAYEESIEAVINDEGSGDPGQFCLNENCVSDLTLGCCTNSDGVSTFQSTLVYVNKSAEDTYKTIFAEAANRMTEIQRTLSNDTNQDGSDGDKEARVEFEEAKEVATAQLDLAFETLRSAALRHLPADLDTYKSLMEACGRCGDTQRALLLIELMKKDGFVLDGEILSCFVAAFQHEDTDNREDTDESKSDEQSNLDAYSRSIRKGLASLQEEKKEESRPWLDFGQAANKSKSADSSELDDTSSVGSSHTDKSWMGSRDSNAKSREKLKKKKMKRKSKTLSSNKVTQMVATQNELGQTLLEIIYPDLQIDTNKQSCPHCSFLLSEDQVVSGWNPCSFDDFTTRCCKCAHRFVPHFSVTSSAPSFKGSQGHGSALFCEFLSPWVVRKALHHVVKSDVGIEGMLDPEWRSGTDIRATLYWNLIVLSRRYNLPFTFLLQGSVQGRIILPRLPTDM